MTCFKMIGAAAIMSMLSAAPAMAQHMIDEPGVFAFFHPMGDLGIASTRPPADAHAMMMMNDSNAMPASGMRTMRHPMIVRRARYGK